MGWWVRMVRRWADGTEGAALVCKTGQSHHAGASQSGVRNFGVFGNLQQFSWINGPLGQQLGVGGVALALPPARFSLGVIVGNRSINLLLLNLITWCDDALVAVAATALHGMQDHIRPLATYSLL
ncbi:MAG: hypothetical protein P8M25_20365 [Paracoccaceae bacterium]|nr:hypothetical protein [Paracoccaceae bacterium]